MAVFTQMYKICRLTEYSQQLSGYLSKPNCLDASALEYALNLWTFPKIPKSKIFVFDTLTHSLKFLEKEKSRYDNNITIYLAECLNPSLLTIMGDPWSLAIKNFWFYNNLCDTENYHQIAPQGTFGCDAIKLIREINLTDF